MAGQHVIVNVNFVSLWLGGHRKEAARVESTLKVRDWGESDHLESEGGLLDVRWIWNTYIIRQHSSAQILEAV